MRRLSLSSNRRRLCLDGYAGEHDCRRRGIMRAYSQSDQHGIAEYLRVCDFLQRRAILSDIHEDADAEARQFDLECPRTLDRKIERMGVLTLPAPRRRRPNS